jgi:hypothetical protein
MKHTKTALKDKRVMIILILTTSLQIIWAPCWVSFFFLQDWLDILFIISNIVTVSREKVDNEIFILLLFGNLAIDLGGG